MMKRWLTVSNLRLGFEVLLVLALLLATLSRIHSGQAAASQAPEAPEATYWYQCNAPNHIGLFSDRIHIFCTSTTPISGAPALNGINWFAFPTSPDSAQASRFMSLLQTSVITARPVWMYLNPADTSGASFGCGSSNCRRMVGMEMR
jgi:hypothetical protein